MWSRGEQSRVHWQLDGPGRVVKSDGSWFPCKIASLRLAGTNPTAVSSIIPHRPGLACPIPSSFCQHYIARKENVREDMLLLEASNRAAPVPRPLDAPETAEDIIRAIPLKRSHKDGFKRCKSATGRTCKCNLTLAEGHRTSFNPQLLGLAQTYLVAAETSP